MGWPKGKRRFRVAEIPPEPFTVGLPKNACFYPCHLCQSKSQQGRRIRVGNARLFRWTCDGCIEVLEKMGIEMEVL